MNIQILVKYYDKTLAIFLFQNLNFTCCQSYLLLLMLDPVGPIFQRIRSQTNRTYFAVAFDGNGIPLKLDEHVVPL